MPDSITIQNTFAQDLKSALDDCLLCINPHETEDNFDPQKAIKRIVRVRAELEKILENVASCGNGVILRQRGYNLLRHLDALRNIVKTDYLGE